MEMLLQSLSPYLNSVQILELPAYSTSIKGIWKNINFVRKNKGQVNHVYSIMDGYLCLFLPNSILTVHDMINLENLKVFPKLIIFILSVFLPSITIKAYHCISNNTKSQLAKYIPWRKKSMRVIYNPLNPLFKPVSIKKGYKDSKYRILQVGTGERKHLDTLIKGVEGLRDWEIELDIVGVLSPAQVELLEASKIRYRNFIDIDLGELVELYNNAHIISFPSSAEGFGMIIIEANASGVPVIAGDIPVLREVGENAAIYIPPLSPNQMKNSIERILSNESIREELIANGMNNIKRFKIEYVSAQYMELYESI